MEPKVILINKEIVANVVNGISMKKNNLYILLLILITGESLFSQNILTVDVSEIDTPTLYFPTQFLIDTVNTYNIAIDEDFYFARKNIAINTNIRYSQALMKLIEPKIYKNYDKECYRFTLLGYFGTTHNPISVRIEKENDSDNNFILISKFINRKHGLISDTITITNKEWMNLQRKIDEVGFWNINPVLETNLIIFDGSEWIFEGKINDKYHMFYRNQFFEEPEIEQLGKLFIKLSKIRLKKREFY
jgi:hypothetical protein